MSEQESAPRDACERYAPALAMLDAPDLDPDERRAALAHLAGCPHCQADQRAYARMDADLRRVFGPAAAAPLRTADLLAAIGATHEPPTRVAMRSVVDLGHFEDTGRMDRMHDTDRRDDESAPVRDRAPIPTLRPGLDARLGWQRWTVGFGATAAALVVIVIAATIFNMRPRIISSPPTLAAATQTAAAQGHVGGAGGIALAISMDSPTDGWAIGQSYSGPPPTPSASGQATSSDAIFYHFNGSAWVQAELVAGFQINQGIVPSVYLKMFSSTDGWAYGWDYNGGGHLVRYDGVAWRPASINLTGGVVVRNVQTLDMVSPTEGWAAAYVKGGAAGTGAVSFLRYDGQRWALDTSGIVLPSGADASQLTITGISVAPDGDTWAVGVLPASSAQIDTVGGVGLVFHRVNGEWIAGQPLNHLFGSLWINPLGISMSSATSGWIVGEADEHKTTSEGITTTVHALLLRYDGAHWTPVSAPLAAAMNYDSLRQIAAAGPNDIWVSGDSDAYALTSGIEIASVLLHYDGRAWAQVTPAVPIRGANTLTLTKAGITGISVTSDGALWAAGGLSTSSNQFSTAPLFWVYRDGAWSALSATSGK